MEINKKSDSRKIKNKDIKNITSSKKGTNKKKVDNKGFTLVELLATITVLAIIITITLSIGLEVIRKSKEKSYQVTIENIENVASSYLSENSNKIFFVDSGGSNNLEYQCVTVQHLIDFGYFDEDITESLVGNNKNVLVTDYVYLSRDKTTKALVKSRYVGEGDSSDYATLCGSASTSLGDIRFSVYPDGWSKKKTITISYSLKNYSDISQYKKSYQYELPDGTLDKNSGDKNFTQTDTIEIDKNGTLTAMIKKETGQNGDNWKDITNSLTISKIDNDKPLVSIDYSGDTVVKQKVTIPIIITDKTSGIDKEEIDLTKNIRVYVSDTEVNTSGDGIKDAIMEFKCVSCTEHDKEWKYNLEITNYYDDGDIKIIIDDDVFYDQANNANDKVVLEPGIKFSNVYTIKFDANGGSPSKTLEKKYGSSLGTLPTATYPGYKFMGWSETKTTAGGTCSSYVDANEVVKADKTYYACWEANVLTIKYSVNGGVIKDSTTSNGVTNSWSTNSNGIILRNGNVHTQTLEYGKSLSSSGLVDYNNSGYIYISKKGYTPPSGQEWKCLSGGCISGKIYSHSMAYKDSDFCDLTKGDCEVILGVNWETNTYNVSYNLGSCINSTNSAVATYDQKFTILEKSNVLVNDGYTFLGWTTNSDGTNDGYNWTDWSGTWTYINGEYGISDGSLILYPMCNINKINVKFNMNGGTFGSTTSTTISYSGSNITRNSSLIVADYDYGTTGIDLANPDNSGYINIVKTGYTPLSGAEWKKSDGTTFSDSGGVDSAKLCDASNSDCTVELFVNWKINTYTITYDANGGTVSTSTVSKNYGDTLGILPTPTYTGYTFKGWSETKTTDGNTCSSYVDANEVVKTDKTYYACWEANVLTIKYSVNGGTIQASTVSSGITYSWTTDSSGLIYRNGALQTQTFNYGESMGTYGLANYDNSTWINITRSGYFAPTGKEWICLSGECKSKLYHQDKVYTTSDFCDLTSSSCEVTIGVNWISDSTKPTCSISVSGVDYPDSVYTSSGVTWYNEDVSLNLSYSDNYEVKKIGLIGETTVSYNNISSMTVTDVTSSSGKTWYGYVMDKAGNEGVCSIKIGITKNPEAYSVQYNTNSCVDVTRTSQTATYGTTFTTLTGSDVTAKAGYKFNGWTTNSNGSDDGYGWTGFSGTWTYTDGQKGISNQILQLYARCEKYKVNVKVNMNGGTFVETTTNKANGVGVSGNYVTRNGNLIYETHYYGDIDVNLTNPDNFDYVNIVKTGYSPVTGAEWKKSDGTTFSDSGGVNANDLCDASKGDCTVELFVNWKANTYTITYDANGGTVSTSTVNRDYETTLGTLPTATYPGYKFIGWSLTKTTPGDTCSSYISSSTTVTGDKTYYACWESNKINVMFNVNGGTFVETTANKTNGIGVNGNYITKNDSTVYITYNYGTTGIDLANPDNASYINISRAGYAPVTGAEWKKSDGTTFSDSGGVNSGDLCDASSGDCTVELFVNWKAKPLYVYYNVNGGTIASSTTSTSGGYFEWSTTDNGRINSFDSYAYTQYAVNLVSTTLKEYNNANGMMISRSGYIAKNGLEWNTKTDGSGVSFSQDTVYSYDDLIDYAIDETDKYTLELYVNWTMLSDVVLISESDIVIDGGDYFETEYGDPSTDASVVDDDLSKQYEVTLPLDLDYMFQVWGAQGGRTAYSSSSSYSRGGYGGFSAGTYAGTANSTIYVNVGGRGLYTSCAKYNSCSCSSCGGYNGGGGVKLYYGDLGAYTSAGGGGGATHIATKSGLLSELSSSKDSILIVAGGGGGGAVAYKGSYSDRECGSSLGGSSYYHVDSDGYGYCASMGGSAGGYYANSGQGWCYGLGGKQISGIRNACSSYYTKFGLGLNTNINTTDYYYGGGGGGGYYGGGSGWGTQNIPAGGGGGSSYINYDVLNIGTGYMVGYGVTESTTDETLTYSTSNVSVAPTIDYAKMNNGYARVTVSNGQGGYYTNGFNYKKNSYLETIYTITSSEITASNLTTYLKCDDSNAMVNEDEIISSGNTITFSIISTTETVCRIYK